MASPLAAKLEFAILSVLVHHHAEVESTLSSWHVSLKLAFPEVKRAHAKGPVSCLAEMKKLIKK